MRQGAVLVFFFATFVISCEAAPLNIDRRGFFSNVILSSTSPSLPSVTQNTTSAPTPTSLYSYQQGTRGDALQHLLSDGPNLKRWVTADGIASTQVGGPDPAGSNKDLEAAVNTVFADASKYRTWVDTYIEFLIEVGNSANGTSNGTTFNKTEYMLAVNVSAAEQTKLVRAYEAAHPGNFTYVGVDIANVSRIDALDMKQMLEWASLLGDQICTSSAGGNVTSRSDGNVASDDRNRFSLNSTDTASSGVDCSPDGAVASYTHQDYLKFVFASSHLDTLDAQRTNSIIPSDMAHQGYSLKTIFPGFGIFNKSMDTGGEGTYTEFVPAWAAKAIAFGGNKFYDFQPEIATMSSNLDNGPSESTDNSSTGLVPRAAGGEAPRFGALQFVADSVTKSSVVSPKPAVAAVAPLKSAGGASVDPLEQPLQDNQSLLVLSLQEGSWADGRDAWVQFAQKNTPDIADKYFGPGKSGSGPIGRHWTHLVLIMTMAVRNGSTGTVETELFGKVWKYCRG